MRWNVEDLVPLEAIFWISIGSSLVSPIKDWENYEIQGGTKTKLTYLKNLPTEKFTYPNGRI